MNASRSNNRASIVYAGGGTGGHIFPALAVCERVREIRTEIGARFICSTRAIDARVLSGARVDSNAVEFAPIHAFPVGLRPRALYRFISHWGMSVRESRAQLRELKGKGPVAVAAFGGFVAAPVVHAARLEGVPVVMVNLDAVPGRANLWIERRIGAMQRRGIKARIVTSAEVGPEHASWTRVGPIVRKAGIAPGSADACREMLGLDPALRTLAITGGSQGAASINDLIRVLAERHRDAFSGWQIVHQCGGGGSGGAGKDADLAGPLREAYAKAGVRARVEPFFDAMGVLWGAADLCVSRAGAGAVAEAWANCVPTVFMPYPYHKDQHQRVNAQVLVAARGAALATDAINVDANQQGEAGRAILELMGSESARGAMRSGLKSLGPADGAERVARTIIDVL